MKIVRLSTLEDLEYLGYEKTSGGKSRFTYYHRDSKRTYKTIHIIIGIKNPTTEMLVRKSLMQSGYAMFAIPVNKSEDYGEHYYYIIHDKTKVSVAPDYVMLDHLLDEYSFKVNDAYNNTILHIDADIFCKYILAD